MKNIDDNLINKYLAAFAGKEVVYTLRSKIAIDSPRKYYEVIKRTNKHILVKRLKKVVLNEGAYCSMFWYCVPIREYTGSQAYRKESDFIKWDGMPADEPNEIYWDYGHF